jgi:cytoskeleton protein RodZ
MAETLGSLLRAKRESLGLTLEEAERRTRLRVRHLQAIESDDLTTIPSVAQARGFIRTYAGFLGVSAEEIDERIGITRPRPRPASASAHQTNAPRTQPRPAVVRSLRRQFLRFDLLLGGAVVLVTVGLLLWGGYTLINSFASAAPEPTTSPLILAATETGTPVAGTQIGTPAAGGTQTGEGTPSGTQGPVATVLVPTVVPTTIPTPLGGVYTDVRIHLNIVQRAYLKIDVDGKTVFARRVIPGETCNPNPTCDFIGLRSIVVSTGNGAGIELIYNGVELGPMGTFGQAISRTFTIAGEVLPTAQPTSVPTITPTTTATPKP